MSTPNASTPAPRSGCAKPNPVSSGQRKIAPPDPPPDVHKKALRLGNEGALLRDENCKEIEFQFSKYVNAARDLQHWAHAADAEERAGRDADLRPLRQLASLQKTFRVLFGVNLLNVVVCATANPFLRRGDIRGLRQAMIQMRSRENVTALPHARRNRQPNFRRHADHRN